MAALLDCEVQSTLEPTDDSLAISATIFANTLVEGGVRLPVLSATWAAPASNYVLGIQIEYGPSDLSSGSVLTDPQGKGQLAWSSPLLVAGKSYSGRYRAVGLGVFGSWVLFGPITMGSAFVSSDVAPTSPTIVAIQNLYDDLLETYGDTVASSSNAAAAAASAAAADLARSASQTAESNTTAAQAITVAARDVTVAAREIATGAASNASAAQANSEAARDITTAARDAAGESAEGAAESASLAASSRDQAGGSASAAAESASAAVSSAGAAESSAAAASSSAISANAAIIQQGRLNLISRFDFRSQYSTPNAGVQDSPETAGTWVATLVRGSSGSAVGFAAFGLSSGPAFSLTTIVLPQFDVTIYADVTGPSGTIASGPSVNMPGGVGLTYDWSNFTIPSAATAVRFIASAGAGAVNFFNPKLEQGSGPSQYSPSPRDGLGYATSGVQSAQTATAQATLAGSSASAADSARTAAETARGQAEIFSSNSAQSATDAAGSESTASAASGVATAARDDAGEAASASAVSASAAESSAGAASSSASAADSDRLEAETARSSAQSARDESVGARDDASGSAAGAAASASLAATSNDAAGGSATAAAGSASAALSSAGAAASSASAASSSAISANAAIIQQGRLNLISRFDFQSQYSTPNAGVQDLLANTGTWVATLVRAAFGTAVGFAAFGLSPGPAFSLRTIVLPQFDVTIYADVTGPSGTIASGPVVNVSGGIGLTYDWSNFTIPSTATAVRFVASAGTGAVNFFEPKLEQGSGPSQYSASPRDGLGYAQSGVQSAQTATAQATLAGDKASAADTSRVAAETAKGLAQTAQTQAAASESNALGSANSASSASIVSATARDEAQAARATAQENAGFANTYANAASGSAATASTKADQAGVSATAADSQRNLAQTARGQAETYRDNAAASASTAAGAESAARSFAGLAARTALGTLNNYPTFGLYDDATATGIPNGYAPWSNCLDQHRVTGRFSDWSFWQNNEKDGVARACGIFQDSNNCRALAGMSVGYYVLEADFELVAGALEGAGIYFYLGGGGTETYLNFATEKDTNETVWGNTNAVRQYSFRKLVRVTNVGNAGGVFHLMTDWEGFKATRTPRIIIWHRAGIRIAQDTEIAAQRADVNAASAISLIGSEASTRASEVAALATRASTAEARASVRTNLFPGFEQGIPAGTTTNGSPAILDSTWGREMRIFNVPDGVGVTSFPARSIQPNVPITITGDSLLFGANVEYCYFDFTALDAANNVVGDSPQSVVSGAHDFSNDPARRTAHAITWTPPSTTVKIIPRFVWVGSGITDLGIRDIKIEYGSAWTAYSTETSQRTLAARTSIVEEVAADAQASLAVARLVLTAEAVGGRPARMGLYSDTYGGSAIALDAATIYFGANTVFDDASDTLQTVWGATRRTIAWGAPFGPDSLTEWEGESSVALSAMTKANGRFWRSSTAPYFGGSALPTTGGTGSSGGASGTKQIPDIFLGSSSGWSDIATFTLNGTPLNPLVSAFLSFGGGNNGVSTTAEFRIIQAANSVVVAGPSEPIVFPGSLIPDSNTQISGLGNLSGTVVYALQTRTTANGGTNGVSISIDLSVSQAL